MTLERILLHGIPLSCYLDSCHATNWHYEGLFGLSHSFYRALCLEIFLALM